MKKLIEWVEIPAADMKRAVNFYNRVFNLQLEVMDFGTEQMACLPNGEGTIFYKPGYLPSKDGVIVSLRVSDSIEASAVRIKDNGGEILMPKTKIEAEGRGYFALCLDSEGNRIGLYEHL